MKNKRILAVIGIVCIAFGLTGCTETFKRNVKSMKSNWTGGLERTVTVYDYNGGVIDSWTGKFDVTDSENEIYFDDEEGKRVIIHGGIVINEEN